MFCILNKAFGDLNPSNVDLNPKKLRDEMNDTLGWRKDSVLSGGFKVGMALDDDTREGEMKIPYDGFDRSEEILSKQRYIVGSTLIDLDLQLFTMLLRFDIFYAVFFKLPKYANENPNILDYLRGIYQLPGMEETFDFQRYRFCGNNTPYNKDNVDIQLPPVDYLAPHDRAGFTQ